MKKLCALFILTAAASMLHADNYGYGGDYMSGGCVGQPNLYQQQGQQGVSNPQYAQGQQGAVNPQYAQGQQGAVNPQYSQGNPLYVQGQPGQNPANLQNPGYGQPGDMPSQQGYGYSQPYGYGQDQQGLGYDQSGANAPQNDQKLTDKIKDDLKSAFSKKYDNVRVTVNNGTVTLSGTVTSQDDKKNLEEKIRGIKGVQNVNNQVTVQEQGQAQGQAPGQAPAPQSY